MEKKELGARFCGKNIVIPPGFYSDQEYCLKLNAIEIEYLAALITISESMQEPKQDSAAKILFKMKMIFEKEIKSQEE